MKSETAEVLATCVNFCRALRSEGVVHAGTEDFVAGLTALDPMRRDDIYWAGRATLCSSPDDLPTYDRIFKEWFRGGDPLEEGETERILIPSMSVSDGSADEPEPSDSNELFETASPTEVLRHRDVATLTDTEQRALVRLFDSLTVKLPQRRARRKQPWHRGELDVRATARQQLRSGAELGVLKRRRPRKQSRRVVFLIDVSRSMTPYADQLLRLAHAVHRVEPRAVDVFTVGTRLTRVTQALNVADPERALHDAGQVIPDWSGGTRLADGLGAFIDRWGRRGTARQAVVVILSDGWERGDTAPLAGQSQRLSKLAHSVIWVNPHRGKPGYEPVQAGIVAVLPHIDHLVAGHTFATFTELLEVIADV